MRTVDGKSFIESGLPPERMVGSKRETPDCDFCKRDPAYDVRKIEFSRNGFQVHLWYICKVCRIRLALHLMNFPKFGER